MAEAPTGTITFLFTDVEGSTRLWQAHPEGMREALATHDGIVRDAIESHDGYIFSTGGDSFAAAFGDPLDAVRAALDAQHALSLAQWGEVEPLRVRMALDTGLAELRDGDYFGPPLNRAARIEELANGGQILLSNTTADLVRYSLPDGFALEPIGERKLRDVERPVQLFQLQPESVSVPGRGFLVGGLAASGAVLAVIIIAAIVLATRSPSVSAPDPTEVGDGGDVSTSAPEPVWSAPVDTPSARPYVYDGVVYVVSSQEDITTLSAHNAATGDQLWTVEADGAAKGDIHSDGRALYVLTGPGPGSRNDRVWVFDPADGSLVGGCGLVLPTGDNTLAVTSDAVYALSQAGSVYLVPTASDSAGRCHDHATENRTFSLFPPLMSGPVVAGSSLLVGDSKRVYELNAHDLTVMSDYSPGSGRHAEYRGAASFIVAESVPIQTPTEIVETVPSYVVDGEGLLHASPDGVAAMAPTEMTVAWEPLVYPSGVILVDTEGTMASHRHDLSRIDWEVGVGVLHDVRLRDGLLYVTDDSGVVVIDVDTGDELWGRRIPGATSAIGDGSRVYIGTATSGVEAFAIEGVEPIEPAPGDPIVPREIAEPLAVVEEYWGRFNAGDADAVFNRYAADASVTDLAGHNGSMMLQVTQEALTEALMRDTVFGWTIEVTDCGIESVTDVGTEVTCDAVAHDAIDRILGVAADGIARLWVRDGLVRRSEFVDRNELSRLTTHGFFYEPTPGYPESVHEFGAWADERFGDGWAAICDRVYSKPVIEEVTECVTLGQDAAVEYMAELGG